MANKELNKLWGKIQVVYNKEKVLESMIPTEDVRKYINSLKSSSKSRGKR